MRPLLGETDRENDIGPENEIGPGTTALSDLDSRDPLGWLSAILWPDESTVVAGQEGRDDQSPGPDASGSGSPMQWWASPSAAKPKILIPADAPTAARTAVRRYHDGFSIKRRMRSVAAELAMANEKVAARSLRNKKVTAQPVSGLAVTSAGVLDGIARLLGIDDLVVAVSLSTSKSNQKPVLQLLDRSGTCHGWAKVAWNARTDALVGTEAYWLERAAVEQSSSPSQSPPLASSVLSVPTLLHDELIDGRRVVITSGVRPSRIPRRHAANPPSSNVFLAVHKLGTVGSMPIAESPWLASVEAVLSHATARERQAIEAALEACRHQCIQVGAWHGDLTPWNLMTVARGVQLIDWEFAADGVPLGFDLCHFHTQVGSEMKGGDAAQALDRSARLSPQGLLALGVSAENRTATWQLYLVELVRRFVALRAGGYPTEGVTQGPAALDRLEHALGLNRKAATSAERTTVGEAAAPSRSISQADAQTEAGVR